MHKRLIEEGFNRRYVLLPLLLSIGLVVLGFGITEARRAQARDLSIVLRERQDVIALIAETVYKALEAESAQRGFLLTADETFLPPMESGLAGARDRLDELSFRYQSLAPEEVKVIRGVEADLAAKVAEMEQSVALLREGKPDDALAVVRSDPGLLRMQAIREELDALSAREHDRFLVGLREWSASIRTNTAINAAATVFTLLVLVFLGLLASRDIRRRESFASQLSAQIDERTAELEDLSRHMSRVVEAEKHALARELHDELGGVLVAMRIDLAQLRKRIGANADPDMKVRWDRIELALAQGLELKRRVIEDLRPTLLDNMGLFTALRWLATQRAEQSGFALEMIGLDDDVQIPPETAIAVFRTAQEVITNIVKHAAATRVSIRAAVGARLTLEISDDGRGIPAAAEHRTGSHGLKQMRFRVEGVGGSLRIAPRMPHGTTIELSVPLPPADAEAEQDA
jgi:signal transduction histidine kinase